MVTKDNPQVAIKDSPQVAIKGNTLVPVDGGIFQSHLVLPDLDEPMEGGGGLHPLDSNNGKAKLHPPRLQPTPRACT
jgi:hypothetical protein